MKYCSIYENVLTSKVGGIMSKKLLRWLSRFAMGIALFSFIVICNFVLFFSYEQKWHIN